MGKIILEFDSTSEQQEAEDSLNGSKWKNIIWQLDQKLRETTKYGKSVITPNVEASDTEFEIAEKYREILREIIADSKLNID